MVDQEVLDSQLKADRFPFPSEGDITLKVRNANYTLGPVMLHIGMKPGAVIPAHLHKAWPRHSMWLRAISPTRASSTRPALRCISRPARHTARTPLRMDASYSSSGRNAPLRRLPISATSSSPKKQLSGIGAGRSPSWATAQGSPAEHRRARDPGFPEHPASP